MIRQAKHVIQTAQPLSCPYDGSTHVVKFGRYKDTQYYLCRQCRRKFSMNPAYFGGHFSKENVHQALTYYYQGMSFRNVQITIRSLTGTVISKKTLWQWIVNYSSIVNEYALALHPRVGRVWVADETVVGIGGENWYYWDLIDADTRFLLATHLSKGRGIFKAAKLMQRAAMQAERAPVVVVTDGLKDYIKGIKAALGLRVQHIRSQGFAGLINTNLIERFHGSLKQRTKVMRHMKHPVSAAIILDGIITNYNFLVPHETLRGMTPAIAAGIGVGATTWGLLVEQAISGHQKPRLTQMVQNPVGMRGIQVIRPKKLYLNINPQEWVGYAESTKE